MTTPTTHCGRCHTCGTRLILVLDGEEWCKTCGHYRRYRSHGWSSGVGENSPCPQPAAEPAMYTPLLDDAAGDYSAGYHSPIYDELYPDWSQRERNFRTNGNTDRMATEVIWLNPAAVRALGGQQLSLFGD